MATPASAPGGNTFEERRQQRAATVNKTKTKNGGGFSPTLNISMQKGGGGHRRAVHRGRQREGRGAGFGLHVERGHPRVLRAPA
ncbi:hypothetical protein GCM10020000_06700 [Streptomyces olivoverticillatus]